MDGFPALVEGGWTLGPVRKTRNREAGTRVAGGRQIKGLEKEKNQGFLSVALSSRVQV